MIFNRFTFILFFLFSSVCVYAQLVSIQQISVEGNHKTKEKIILRELLFNTGDVLETDSITALCQQSASQLINLNLFNKVEVIPTIKDSLVLITVRVTEKWYIWPIPFVEFADRNFNQWWDFKLNPDRVNYGLYAFVYNVAGMNYTAKISLINGYTRNIGGEFRIPYINSKKTIGINTGVWHRTNHEIVYQTKNNFQQFYHNQNKTVNYRIGGYAEVVYRKKYFTSQTAGVSVYTQRVDSQVLYLNRDYLNGKQKLAVASLYYQVLYRKVDNKFFPQKGFIASGTASLNTELQNRKLFWPEVFLQASAYTMKHNRLGAAAGLSVRYRPDNRYAYPFQQALGYRQQMVRGYERYVIDGSAYALLKAEARYNILNNRYINTNFLPLQGYKKTNITCLLTAFTDAGFVQNKYANSDNSLAQTLLISAGAGINWVFYFDKVIRFEYSVNRLKQGGFYLHFAQAF